MVKNHYLARSINDAFYSDKMEETFVSTDKLIELALNEDLGETGDVTSEPIFSAEKHAFKLISKDTGILCGIGIFKQVMKMVDEKTDIRSYFNDRDNVKIGDVIADISGKVVSILKAERTALNFLSMLSAVATKTAEYVKEAGGRLVILDTRKTIPGFRQLQKYAVQCGGGSNHRMGLYDMVMIKDNHIDAAGGITAAVNKIREKWSDRFKIEVETRDLEEVREAVACGVDRIMLDNMDNSEIAAAVKLTEGKCETEASGNITLARIKSLTLTGVNFISSGDLTHSIKAFDFSLKEI